MNIETRIRRIEAVIGGSKRIIQIWKETGETEAEAIKRYEKENNMVIDEDKHNLMILGFVKDRADAEKLKQEKENEN